MYDQKERPSHSSLLDDFYTKFRAITYLHIIGHREGVAFSVIDLYIVKV